MLKSGVFVKIKQFFVNFYNKNKKLFFITISLCVFLIVIMFSSVGSNLKNSTNNTTKSESFSVDDYAENIETKLEGILLSINSVSKVEVFVMLESSPIKQFLTEKEETKNNNGTETKKETIVFEKNGSTSTPVEIYTAMPRVSGVLIFLNKIDASTKLSIINAVSVVLNVDESCISILQER